MSVLIDRDTTIVIQGITGRQGRTSARLMKEYGSKVVAGVTPGKGGRDVEGIPVFDTVAAAAKAVGPIAAAVAFVPAPRCKEALLEAIDAGVRIVMAPVDRMPIHDVIEVVHVARRRGVRMIGPNTAGIISVGKSILGMLGGSLNKVHELFLPGHVGILSRSGGMTTTIAYWLTQAGIGQSTAISIGGDAIIGSTFPELLPLFQKDRETRAVALYGEIGSTQEERVAEMMRRGEFTKPLVAYIAGISAPAGTRFSHSAAIVSDKAGGAQNKIDVLREAGAYVVDDVMDIPQAMAELL